MPVSSLAVCNYFINESIKTGKELTPMKLLKLVYVSHGWHLALSNGEPLIPDAVEAWKYGPVIPFVYHTIKHYGQEQISSQIVETRSDGYGFFIPQIEVNELKIFLDKMWEVYSNFSGLQLSTITHEPGSPWDTVWNKQGGNQKKSVIIPNNVIEEYYKGRLKKK